MQVSKEEILHIANLARLDLNENEVDKYIENLQDILNFANIVNNAPVEGLDITIGANEAKNIFRKDEIKRFEDTESLLQNAPSQEQNMFKLPKVIQ
jgi:aspartyl-tRNA(Asn)/glutamyl-tRNA(Gln) amidotransferase subunit C